MKTTSNRPTMSDPEIVTYDRSELTMDIYFAGGTYQTSSRRAKTAFKNVNARRILRRAVNKS